MCCQTPQRTHHALLLLCTFPWRPAPRPICRLLVLLLLVVVIETDEICFTICCGVFFLFFCLDLTLWLFSNHVIALWSEELVNRVRSGRNMQQHHRHTLEWKHMNVIDSPPCLKLRDHKWRWIIYCLVFIPLRLTIKYLRFLIQNYYIFKHSVLCDHFPQNFYSELKIQYQYAVLCVVFNNCRWRLFCVLMLCYWEFYCILTIYKIIFCNGLHFVFFI